MMSKFGLFFIYLIAFVCTVVIGIATGMPKPAVYALGLWTGFIASLLIEEA
ncbi:hypothetical protein [Providencia stuartii]|uniref:hypothetical protein n=1 Tax=Providencia stuartii TaxID=588 RepID=UPI0023B0020F|nr:MULTISPECIES: hypothetical protein [Providencia]MDE8747115.1 hypothetical protein [Providencia thailandensis]MDE8765666.1 hypothetical protein [Providencia thailandensis]MDE8777902.1 hypothetical protein [Providencia thailandensis]MDE8782362.1 hypothetical protein [Providencia thailandensis]MDE8786152.1 hypothetical protein [Providencia thailandensis]